MKSPRIRSAAPGGWTRSRTSVALLVAVTAASGCYQYHPAEVEPAPPVGEDVRLVVSRGGAVEFAEVVDLTDDAAPSILGRLERAEPGALMVRVPLRQSEGQPGLYSDVGQLIRVPNAQILGIERREFDPVMSSLLVGGLIGGATVLLLQIMDTAGSATDDVEGPLLLRMGVRLGPGIGR